MSRNGFAALALAALLLGGCGGGGEGGATTADTALTTTDTTTTTTTTATGPEPYYYQQWYLQCDAAFCSEYDVSADAGIQLGYDQQRYNGGAGVTVAVIDDGLDVSHPDIAAALVASYDVRTGGSDVAPDRPAESHGTAVTGIAVARINAEGIAGVAPKSRLVFIKYASQMSDSETIAMFYKAAELGADVINCSWGTYDVSPAVRDAIVDLATNGRDGKGIVFVFAVGNGARDVGNDESAIPEVIAVGSSDEQNDRAWYSNYGENLDILAPGGTYLGITTTDVTGSLGYGTIDPDYILATDPLAFIGTSASAPITTGVVALMLAKNPNLTRAQIESLLHTYADKIGDVEYVNGFNLYYGYGKLNAARVLEAVQ
jgi:subtilisin family serine protease